MGIVQSLSKRWIILVAGLAIVLLTAAGILALMSGQAATEEPTPVVAEIQLNPWSGRPGSHVTVVGSGWQPGETVLVYLVETESNATDGAIYVSSLANRNGQIAGEFDYPQTLPWAAEQSTIVEARGLSSRRTAQALFQVLPSAAQPTTEPPTSGPPTSEPPTAQPTSEPPATQTPSPTATPVPPMPTATHVPTSPTATPVPPTPTTTPVPPTPTLAPPIITDWRGEYYDNRDLMGSPRLVRNDPEIRFDWGARPPASGLPADNWSARWTRSLDFAEGPYRFTVEVDDGARLWVDGELLIDQWHDGIGSYTGDIYLTRGTHDLRLEMYEHLGDARARLGWSLVQDYPDWRGEYYTNRDLAGSPRMVRNDPKIDFDWGTGSPAAGLPADNWSARWTRSLDFAEGPYRFTVEVDDGARLWVDGQLVIDQWHDGIGSYTGDIYLTRGTHDLRLEMYEHLGDARARLGWSLVQDYPDWKGEYYTNRDLMGSPRLVRNDPKIDFDWGTGSPAAGLPADNWSARWTRSLGFAEGPYRFTVEVDDGARLWVDGQLVIDQWHDGIGSYTGGIYLTRGTHDLRLEMYEHLGDARARLGWSLVQDYPDWKGEYYTNRDLAGSPRLVRNDPKIDFDWGTGSPAPLVGADSFSVRWMRAVDFAEGLYRFCAQADDGVRVQVDDREMLIEEWHDGPGAYCTDTYLTAGRHKFRVDYYEHLGEATIQFGWQQVIDGQVPPDAIRPIKADLWAGEPVFAALDSAEEYRKFLQQHSLRSLLPGVSVLPQIRWDEEIVLAALLGEKSAGGYPVEVTGITYQGTDVTVHLRIDQVTPEPTTADQVITSPYALVAVQRQPLPEGDLAFTFVDQDGRWLGQAQADNHQPVRRHEP